MIGWVSSLFKPVFNDFVIPKAYDLLKPVADIGLSVYRPYSTLRGNITKDQAVVEFDKLLTAAVRAARITATYFIYEAARKKIGRYFGNVGTCVTLISLYNVGTLIDPKSNHSSAIAWLLMRGSELFIKSWGTDPMTSLGFFFFICNKQKQPKEDDRIASTIPGLQTFMRGVIHGAAASLAGLCGYQNPPPTEQPPE
jgi:hypothetical protein